MNAVLSPLAPLPRALSRLRRDGMRRRHRVGHHPLDPGVLHHFNDLIARIDLQRAPLDRDELASAARELIDDPRTGLLPPCIGQRLRRAGAIGRMTADREWEATAPASLAAAVVVDYLRGRARLIPHTMPVIGRLDDAILIDAAWPALAGEVADYLDYRRLRHIEATLRGERRPHFGFTREHWLEARRAEAEWIGHCRRVGRSSYVADGGAGRFRVN